MNSLTEISIKEKYTFLSNCIIMLQGGSVKMYMLFW